MDSKEQKIEHLLTRNVEEVIEHEHLRAALLAGKKLRVKHGIDPTGPKMHIGRAVVLWKLREFQELGHTIILIIGDFTAQIGDPSDKLEKRPFLSREQVEKNMKEYLPQIGKILDLKKTEVRHNSEWLAKLNFRKISELAETFTIQQMIERRNFKDRIQKHEEVSLRELLYPLMQGYDSVAIKSDVELGGTDQLFNLLAGRKIQERYGQKPQDIMTTDMIVGLDGRKMSTSWGNVINIADAPEEQFGKVMSLRDELILEYFRTTTDLSAFELDAITLSLQKENPKIAKEKLAVEIVTRYHGAAAAKKAKDNFEKVFSRHEMPDEMPELKLKTKKLTALDIVDAAGVMKSRSEARRLIEQGGFEFDGKTIKNPVEEIMVRGGEVARVGKKNFFKVK